MARIQSAETVRVQGLDELRRELRKLDDDGLIDGLKDANYDVAQMVVARAKIRAAALGGMEHKAAETLKAGRNQRRAEVSLGGTKAPFAGGAEFGAYHDVLRLRKAGTARAYIVRDDSARGVAKARKRIEAQSNINTGQRTQVVGMVRGWNQFRKWRGNRSGAGYFLFPAMRQLGPQIVETYGDAIDKLTAKAFPD
jgi:hypothetical protein